MKFVSKPWNDVGIDDEGIYYMYGSIPMKFQKVGPTTMHVWDSKGSGPVPFSEFVPELTEVEVKVE